MFVFELDHLLLFILFAFNTLITPGPNNLMLMSSGANFGYRRTLPHLTGIAVGFSLLVLLSGLILGELFALYPALHIILKYCFFVYFLYLAWTMLGITTLASTKKARPLTLIEAALFQCINPKAISMAIGATTTYTTTNGHYTTQILILSIIYGAMVFPLNSVWILFGQVIARWLGQGKRQIYFNAFMAVLLILTIAYVLRL